MWRAWEAGVCARIGPSRSLRGWGGGDDFSVGGLPPRGARIFTSGSGVPPGYAHHTASLLLDHLGLLWWA